MKTMLVVVSLLAAGAWADIPNPNPAPVADVSCVGQAEGAACGAGGTCRRFRVRRPDFSSGAPVWGWTEVMVCTGSTQVVALAVVVLVGALLAWRRRTTVSLTERDRRLP